MKGISSQAGAFLPSPLFSGFSALKSKIVFYPAFRTRYAGISFASLD